MAGRIQFIAYMELQESISSRLLTGPPCELSPWGHFCSQGCTKFLAKCIPMKCCWFSQSQLGKVTPGRDFYIIHVPVCFVPEKWATDLWHPHRKLLTMDNHSSWGDNSNAFRVRPTQFQCSMLFMLGIRKLSYFHNIGIILFLKTWQKTLKQSSLVCLWEHLTWFFIMNSGKWISAWEHGLWFIFVICFLENVLFYLNFLI